MALWLNSSALTRLMTLIDKLAEQKIKDSIEQGVLDDLPGRGQPLVLDDDSAVPAELRAGYRILKNAGFVPQQIALRNDIRSVEELLLQAGSLSEKKKLVLKLSLLRSQL